jgi:hypothetical protein
MSSNCTYVIQLLVYVPRIMIENFVHWLPKYQLSPCLAPYRAWIADVAEGRKHE